MVVRDPGDAYGGSGKRTSTTQDQYDPGKVKALEEKDGPTMKEIGAKMNKNNKNGQNGTSDLVTGNNSTSTAIDRDMILGSDDKDDQK